MYHLKNLVFIIYVFNKIACNLIDYYFFYLTAYIIQTIEHLEFGAIS